MTEHIEGPRYGEVLTGDVLDALSRLDRDDAQTHRRELVRSIFAFIEGFIWEVGRDLATRDSALSRAELAALGDWDIRVTSSGEIKEHPRQIPIPNAMRMMTQIANRHRTPVQIDYGTGGWEALQKAIKVRNRLTHPKKLDDLEVSNDDLKAAIGAFSWTLEYAFAFYTALEPEDAKRFYEILVDHRNDMVRYLK